MLINKREKRTKYAKIPKKHKILFLKKVLQQNQPLKQTADQFRINYSTAKTLIRQYRSDILDLDLTECENNEENRIDKGNESLKRCIFKEIFQVQKVVESTGLGFDGDESLKRILKSEQEHIYEPQWSCKQEKRKGITIICRIQFA